MAELTGDQTGVVEHPNAVSLRSIDGDLSTIGVHLADDVLLHAAIRDENGDAILVSGKSNVIDHQLALIQATWTAGRAVEHVVEHIHANDFFGAVFRQFRVGDDMAMPFCGLGRFVEGLVAECWENAYDATALLPRRRAVVAAENSPMKPAV